MFGSAGCGKSTLQLDAFVGKALADYMYIPTIGIEFYKKTIRVDDQHIVVEYGDMAVLARFRSIITPCCRVADGILLV